MGSHRCPKSHEGGLEKLSTGFQPGCILLAKRVDEYNNVNNFKVYAYASPRIYRLAIPSFLAP
jgi:hypothetical protein